MDILAILSLFNNTIILGCICFIYYKTYTVYASNIKMTCNGYYHCFDLDDFKPFMLITVKGIASVLLLMLDLLRVTFGLIPINIFLIILAPIFVSLWVYYIRYRVIPKKDKAKFLAVLTLNYNFLGLSFVYLIRYLRVMYYTKVKNK